MRHSLNRHPSARFSWSGFTLVELLVVIGIIAVLISILLPTLARARRSANTIKCAANLHAILQGMQIYAAQNNGSIPGSAWSTARLIYNNDNMGTATGTATLSTVFTSTNLPTIVGLFDWASPIARVEGMNIFPDAIEDGSLASRQARWHILSNHQAFMCPENTFISVPFTSTESVGTQSEILFSYNTALGFLLKRSPGTSNSSSPLGATGRTVGRGTSGIQNPPSNYSVKVSQVGTSARKIYIGDGARFCNNTTAPDFDLTYTGGNGGAFADQGPPFKFSAAWTRGWAPGNASATGSDKRPLAWRHGSSERGEAADRYKGNFGFFDGHVELLGDLESCDPEFWWPKGTELTIDSSQVWNDVITRYFGGVAPTGLYIVP